METLTYSIIINANRKKVWKVLWESYELWTKCFAEKSHAVSDWKEGSRIEFHDGKGGGMYSEIVKLEPARLMMFQHLGSIINGKDVDFSGDLEDWTNNFESYRLSKVESGTELTVEIDSTENFKEFLDERFPKALAKVKELAETNQ